MLGKYTIGSIEEDFKKIGLIQPAIVESAPEAKVAEVVAAEPAVVVAEPVAAVAAPVVAEPVVAVPAAPVATEGLKLLRKKRPTGKLRMQRRKQKMLRRRNKGKLKLKAKRFRRSARGKRFLQKYKRAVKRFHGHAPKGKRISLKMGLDRVADMLEDVKEIVTALDSDAKQETIKSFANLAIISSKLAENYACACRNLEVEDEEEEEIDLCGGAEHFEALANSAANLAEALQTSMQEGTEFEGTSEEVNDTFQVMLADVLEGLDVFADLSEADVVAKPDEAVEALRTRTTRDITPDDEEESCEDCDDDDDSDDDDDEYEKDSDDDDDDDSASDRKDGEKSARPTK